MLETCEWRSLVWRLRKHVSRPRSTKVPTTPVIFPENNPWMYTHPRGFQLPQRHSISSYKRQRQETWTRIFLFISKAIDNSNLVFFILYQKLNTYPMLYGSLYRLRYSFGELDLVNLRSQFRTLGVNLEGIISINSIALCHTTTINWSH